MRYQSVKAFGRDLQRWLDGDPVEALHHKPFYRLKRLVRKNKTLAAVSALLAITLVTATAWGIRASVRSKLQIKYYQYFGQEAERIEAFMALAESMPLRDTLPERKAIREQIRGFEQTIARHGSLAEAPGLYAMGRGYIALEDWNKARQVLERAWKLGLRTPEVAYALGSCLSQIYRNELRGLAGPKRKERKEELDRTLKPLILDYLSQARRGSQTITVAFAEAQLAWAEGRYTEAIAQANQVLHNQPWKVQALLLKAEVYLAQANERALGAAQPAKGDTLREQALVLVKQAQGISHSCAAAYGLEAWIRYEEMINTHGSKKDVTRKRDQVLEATGKMRQAYSQNSTSFLREAEAWLEEFQRSFDDTREAINHAIGCVQRAQALDPDSASTLDISGYVWLDLAQWELEQGLDPDSSLQKCVAVNTSALQRYPNDSKFLSNLGNAFSIKSAWEMGMGQEALGSFQQALNYYTKAEALKPEAILCHNMAITHQWLARYWRWQGQDAQSHLASALRIMKSYMEGHQRGSDLILAITYLQRAEYAAWDGKVDLEALRLGRYHAGQVLFKEPDDPFAMDTHTWCMLIESLNETGEPNWETAKQTLQQALRILPKEGRFHYHDAWLGLEKFRKAPSWRAYLALEERIKKALTMPRAYPELHFLAAEACRWAIKRKAPGATKETWRRCMQDQIEQAKRQNPLISPLADRWLKTNGG